LIIPRKGSVEDGVKNTHDFRAAIDLALDIQSRPDDVGAIAHDTNAHAAAALAWQFESRPVVLDGQLQAVSVPSQGYDHGRSFTMVDCIQQGFLHDVI